MPAVRDILPTKLRLSPTDKADYQMLFWSLTGDALKLTNDAFQAVIYTLPADRVVTSYNKRSTQYIVLTSSTLCLKAKVSKDRKDEWLAALTLPATTTSPASTSSNITSVTEESMSSRRATVSSRGSGDHAYISDETALAMLTAKATVDDDGGESLAPLGLMGEPPRRMGRMRRSSVV